jgi:hypothetical protein
MTTLIANPLALPTALAAPGSIAKAAPAATLVVATPAKTTATTATTTATPAAVTSTTGNTDDSDGSVLASNTSGSSLVTPSSAQVNPLLDDINTQLPTTLTNLNNTSQADYDKAIAGYTAQDAIDQANITGNVQSNEQSLTANEHAALINAINGESGLNGELSSIGGLSGSGADVVSGLVGSAEGSDLGSARSTFNTNAATINTAAEATTQAEKQRMDDAAATLANDESNNSTNVLTSQQSIYQQLANLYGTGTAEGNDYAAKAAALTAQITAQSKGTVAGYDTGSSLYTPAALATYLAGTQNLSATTSAPTSGSTSTSATADAINAANSTKKTDDSLVGVA